MSIFLYPATDQTASQHPCRFPFAAAVLVTGHLFITTPVRALDCDVIPDCASLGYSTEDVDDCEAYLYCPFDESYKKCVSKDYCADYTLSECPTAAICSSCGK